MQKTNFTIGQGLNVLSKTHEKEPKEFIKATLEGMISKYPEEENMLSFLIKEAAMGKTSTSLATGVLAPDFTEENIISEVDNGHTIIRWDNN